MSDIKSKVANLFSGRKFVIIIILIATFLGGAVLMILGQIFPELISPFSHGIELRTGRGYSYIGELYNIFVCEGIGVIVTLFTMPESDKNLNGLTVFDVHKLKEIFKGSAVNEKIGKKLEVNWKLDNSNSDILRFSRKDMTLSESSHDTIPYWLISGVSMMVAMVLGSRWCKFRIG